MSYEWRPELSVGHAILDAQHKKLFETLNKLHSVVEKGKNRRDLLEVVGELERYVTVHFSLEEHKMREAGYPGLKEHIQEHQRLAKKVNDMIRPIREGDLWPAASLMRSLIDWIGDHVAIQDLKYAPWIRADKGPAGANEQD